MPEDRSARPTADKIRALLQDLSKEEQALLAAVLMAERDKLHMKKPYGINDDIWSAVTETIK